MHILLGLCTFLKRYKYFFSLLIAGIAILVATEYREHPTIQCPSVHSQKSVLEIFSEGEYEGYLELTKDQPKEKKLQWSQFQDIAERYKEYGKNQKSSELFEIASILQMDIEVCLNKLKEIHLIEKKEELFEAAFLEHLKQIAEKAPEAFTRDIYKDLLRLRKAALLLKTESSGEAFSYYIARLEGLLELDRRSVLGMYLIKEAIKKHIYTKLEIQVVKNELLARSSDEICKIIHGVHEGEHQYQGNQEYPQHQK